jgi:hypothetical protein
MWPFIIVGSSKCWGNDTSCKVFDAWSSEAWQRCVQPALAFLTLRSGKSIVQRIGMTPEPEPSGESQSHRVVANEFSQRTPCLSCDALHARLARYDARMRWFVAGLVDAWSFLLFLVLVSCFGGCFALRQWAPGLTRRNEDWSNSESRLSDGPPGLEREACGVLALCYALTVAARSSFEWSRSRTEPPVCPPC